jgi:uncharacterized protein
MRFTQDNAAGVNVVRGYGDGEIRINDRIFGHAVLVSAAQIQPAQDLAAGALADEAQARHLELRILALEPELVLLGSGSRQIFPPAAFGARFLRAGIGFEVMDTGAACRTFNVLVAEQRRVVAVLFV